MTCIGLPLASLKARRDPLHLLQGIHWEEGQGGHAGQREAPDLGVVV